jgi:hypothetical protein
VPQLSARARTAVLVVVGHGGPLLGRTSWRKPDTYHAAGIEPGTATSTSTTRGTTSVAAAAYQRELAESLVAKGADARARNRRGAEPLHYAADGGPDADHWDPVAQREVLAYLIAAGADPNALDNSGVAPLHRAVRNRCSAAASALIDNGADPRLTNKSGSTPLHLAVQNTGKSNSGSEASKDEQGRVIALLLGHGARPADVDANGKSVAAAASSDWIRHLLDTP